MNLQDLVISISPDIDIGPLSALENKLQAIAVQLDKIGDKLIKTAAVPQLIQGGFAAVFAIEEKKIAQTAALMGQHIDHVKNTYMKAISDISASSGMARSISWEGVRQAHRGGIANPKEQLSMTAKATKLQASGFGRTTEIISAATTAAVAADVEPIGAVDLFAKGVQSGEGAGAAEFAPGFKTLAGVSGTSKIPFEDLWAALIGLSTTDKNTTRATTKLRSFVRDLFNIERMQSKKEALQMLSEEAYGDPNAITQKTLIDMVRRDGGFGKVLETVNKLSGGGNLDKLLKILTAEGAQLPGLIDRNLFDQKRSSILNYRGVSEQIYSETAEKTLSNSFARVAQSLNALSTEIGKNLTPLVKTLLAPVEAVTEKFRDLGGGVLATFSTALAVVTASMFALGAAFKGVGLLLSNWGVAALGVGAAAFTESGSKWVKGKASRTFDWARASQEARGDERGDRNVKHLDSMKGLAEKIGKFDPAKAWETAKKAIGGIYTIGSMVVISSLAAAKDVIVALLGGLTRFVTSGAGKAAESLFSKIFGSDGIFSKFTDEMTKRGGGLASIFSIFTNNTITRGMASFTAGLAAMTAKILASPIGMAVAGTAIGYGLIDSAAQKHDQKQKANLKLIARLEDLHGEEIGSKQWKRLKGEMLMPSIPKDFLPIYELTEEGKINDVRMVAGKSGRDPSDFKIFGVDGYRNLDASEEKEYLSMREMQAPMKFYSLTMDKIKKSRKRWKKIYGDVDSAIGQGADERNALQAILLGYKYKDGAWEQLTGLEDEKGNLESIRLNEFEMQNVLRKQRGLNPMGFFSEFYSGFDRSSPSTSRMGHDLAVDAYNQERFSEIRRMLGLSTDPLSGWEKIWESVKYITRNLNPITGIPEAFRMSSMEFGETPFWQRGTLSLAHRRGLRSHVDAFLGGGPIPGSPAGPEDIDQILYGKAGSAIQGTGELLLEAFNLGERKDHLGHLYNKASPIITAALIGYQRARNRGESKIRSVMKGGVYGYAASAAWDLMTDEDGEFVPLNTDAALNLAASGAAAVGLYYAGKRLWRPDSGYMTRLGEKVHLNRTINTGPDGKYVYGSRDGDPRGGMGKQPFKTGWGARLGGMALAAGKFATRGLLGPVGWGLLAYELLTSQIGKVIIDGLKAAFDKILEFIKSYLPGFEDSLDTTDAKGNPTTREGWLKKAKSAKAEIDRINSRIEKGDDFADMGTAYRLSSLMKERNDALKEAEKATSRGMTVFNGVEVPVRFSTTLPVAPHSAAKAFVNPTSLTQEERNWEGVGERIKSGDISINIHGVTINESENPDLSLKNLANNIAEAISTASQSKDSGR